MGKFWYQCTHVSAISIKIQSFYSMHTHKQILLWDNLLAFNSSKKTKDYGQQCSLKFRGTT